MTGLKDQHHRFQRDLAMRRNELERLYLSPEQTAALSRMEVAHIAKMRSRLTVEIAELERYIESMGRLVD